ncbi:MAG: FeoB-associated Cys-rich membrane protein [Clostridium sp.]
MATAIIGTLVLGSFAGTLYYTYIQKKKGVSSCSGCNGCANRGLCNK